MGTPFASKLKSSTFKTTSIVLSPVVFEHTICESPLRNKSYRGANEPEARLFLTSLISVNQLTQSTVSQAT